MCVSLNTTQHHGLHHSLNVHNIYRENDECNTNITLHVAGGCEEHWSMVMQVALACSSFTEGEEYMQCVAGVWQWLLERDSVNYLTYLQEIGTSTGQPATHAVADTGVHLFNADIFIIIYRTSVDRRISQTAHEIR